VVIKPLVAVGSKPIPLVSAVIEPELKFKTSPPDPAVKSVMLSTPAVEENVMVSPEATAALSEVAEGTTPSAIAMLNVSTPEPPVKESPPVPPVMASTPAAPLMESLPVPPIRASVPEPPVIESAPVPPVKVKPPEPPVAVTPTSEVPPSTEMAVVIADASTDERMFAVKVVIDTLPEPANLSVVRSPAVRLVKTTAPVDEEVTVIVSSSAAVISVAVVPVKALIVNALDVLSICPSSNGLRQMG